jgi:hypothetical protein
MAVLKNHRTESSVQFLDTAMKLEIFTIKQCVKFPKRYTHFISNQLVELAVEIFNDVKRANSVFLDKLEAFELRTQYISRAERNLQCLISQLSIAKEIFGNEKKVKQDGTESSTPMCSQHSWIEWNDLIIEEIRLLGNLKKSDKERKKKFN